MRISAGDLGEERAQHAQLVQGLQRSSHAALAHQHLPELEVSFAIVGTQPVQLLQQEVARVAVDGHAIRLGDGVEADHVRRTPREHLAVVDGDAAVPEVERGIDGVRLVHPARLGRVLDGAAIDQRLGSAGELLKTDVRVAHQLLDAELAARIVAIGERLRDAPLVVEGEPVVAPAGRIMQLVAEAPEQIAGGARCRNLARGQESALAGFAQARHLVARSGDPEGGLQIAQSAFALLQVRLEQPDRAAVAPPPLAELLQLVGDELLHLARLELRQRGSLQRLEELRVAGDQARVEQRRANGVVLARRLQAAFQRARGEARLEAGIPERAVELLGDLLRSIVLFFGEQREQVDVRARRQLAPAIAARRDESQRRPSLLGGDGAKQLGDDFVGERRDSAHDLLSAGARAMTHQQRRVALFEASARERRQASASRLRAQGHAENLTHRAASATRARHAAGADAVVRAPAPAGGGYRRSPSLRAKWPLPPSPGSARS